MTDYWSIQLTDETSGWDNPVVQQHAMVSATRIRYDVDEDVMTQLGIPVPTKGYTLYRYPYLYPRQADKKWKAWLLARWWILFGATDVDMRDNAKGHRYPYWQKKWVPWWRRHSCRKSGCRSLDA